MAQGYCTAPDQQYVGRWRRLRLVASRRPIAVLARNPEGSPSCSHRPLRSSGSPRQTWSPKAATPPQGAQCGPKEMMNQERKTASSATTMPEIKTEFLFTIRLEVEVSNLDNTP